MFLLGSFRTWVKQLWINRGCNCKYVHFALLITISRFFTILFRINERIFSGRAIKSTVIDKSPVFIIGHWRSGTTYLHNLMANDQNMGHMSLVQAIVPESMLFKNLLLKNLLAGRTSAVRPMDNVPLSPDAPQEEEFAMANMTSCSFYHQWMFPGKARYYFKKYALLADISPKDLAVWKKTYLNLLRKITLNAGNRRIVLKNPVNTGRVRALLELFPNARFIHIYRNPYIVFPSTLNLYDKMLKMCQVRQVPQSEIEDNILMFYEKLMHKYFDEKNLIPAGNLVEVRFEDLEADPLVQLRRIYEVLQLPGFTAAAPAFRNYITSQAGYHKNTYILDKDTVDRISRKWQFFIDAWGYQPPDV